jgi:hypothetical protein
MNPTQAIQFIEKLGVTLESAHDCVSKLAETIAGVGVERVWRAAYTSAGWKQRSFPARSRWFT